jgi:hypothetical protein
MTSSGLTLLYADKGVNYFGNNDHNRFEMYNSTMNGYVGHWVLSNNIGGRIEIEELFPLSSNFNYVGIFTDSTGHIVLRLYEDGIVYEDRWENAQPDTLYYISVFSQGFDKQLGAYGARIRIGSWQADPVYELLVLADWKSVWQYRYIYAVMSDAGGNGGTVRGYIQNLDLYATGVH